MCVGCNNVTHKLVVQIIVVDTSKIVNLVWPNASNLNTIWR